MTLANSELLSVDIESMMELLLALGLGLGLAAACGFRVFLPLFFVGIAARTGYMDLPLSFEWIESNLALACLGVATVCEILGYYIPWFDNLLDTVATPAAAVAGSVTMMGMTGDMAPLLKWALGIIAGGGSATVIQLGTAALRGGSSVSTGGIANPLVSTSETVASGGMVLLAVFVPVLVGIVAIASIVFAILLLRKMIARRTQMRHSEA